MLQEVDFNWNTLNLAIWACNIKSVDYWLELELCIKRVISGQTDISHKIFNSSARLMQFFFLFSAWFLQVHVSGKCKKILQERGGGGGWFFHGGGGAMFDNVNIWMLYCNSIFSSFFTLEIVFRYFTTLLKKNSNCLSLCSFLYAYQGKLQIDTDGQLSICRQRVSVKTCM